MKKRIFAASKYIFLSLIMALSLMTGTLFGQRPVVMMPPNDQRVQLGDSHSHTWDDLRMLLITITEVSDNDIHWKHQTPFETKAGAWHLGKNLKNSDRGVKSDRIRPGRDFIAVYCSQCETVIWLYDSK